MTREPLPEEQRERLPPIWDMSQERAFIEDLLCKRFNFFIIFFSVIAAGAINAIQYDLLLSGSILSIGLVVCWPLRSVLARSQEKLDIILDQLLPDDHPAKELDRRSRKGGSRRRVIGVTIPLICCWVLTLALFAEIVLQVAKWVR